MFSCEFCEISKNTFFTEHLLVTASEMLTKKLYMNTRKQFFRLDETRLNTSIQAQTFIDIQSIEWMIKSDRTNIKIDICQLCQKWFLQENLWLAAP